MLSVREFRAGLAEAIQRVRERGPVFVGSHRKAEAVLMSVERYDELMAAAGATVPRWVAVDEAVASVRVEGPEPSAEGRRRLEAVARGELSTDEAISQALAPYRRGD